MVMTLKQTTDMAREAGVEVTYEYKDGDLEWGCSTAQLKAFEALVRADEREAIKDEWWMCVQSDLENGVKSLNEQAATKWREEYPKIAKFGAWLNARGNT
jgi:transposase-like protein